MKKALISMSVASLFAASGIPAQAAENLIYVPVNPCRIVDTRTSQGGEGPITAESSRNFLVSGTVDGQGGTTDGCPAPRPGSEPLAISAYVIAVPTADSIQGVLTAYPSDQPQPAVGEGSTVNFDAGEIIGNTSNISLCEPDSCPADGEFAILARKTDQHVVVDVQGYYYPETGTCPDDMVAAGSLCVDTYEASVWDASTSGGTQYGVTAADYPCNNDGSDCGASAANPIYAISEVSQTPSARITQYQASIACANVGKRLPTTAEWQMAASGTPAGTGDGTTGCNSQSGNAGLVDTGSASTCVSTVGAFDMVGNVWEWAAELGDDVGAEFTTTDAAVARALGEGFNNGGGITPSTKSLFLLDNDLDAGANAQNPQIGFRCVR